jgi:hypothetical protein
MTKPLFISAFVLSALAVAGVALAYTLRGGEVPSGDPGAGDSLRMERLRDQAVGDFKRITDTYRDGHRLSMAVDHRVYATYDSREPIEEERSTLRRSGRRLYNDAFGSITIMTDSMLVQIEPEDRRMLVSRLNGVAPDSILPSDIDIEESLEQCDSMSYTELPNGRGAYRLWYGEGAEIRSLEVEFVRATGVLERTIFYMAEDAETVEGGAPAAPRVEIVYSRLDSTSGDESVFEEDHYFKRSGPTLSCTAAYAGFELIDLRVGGGE